MAQPQLKYYNMLIHLVRNNRLYEENAAIKKVWRKENNIFMDVYFYRNQKSYIFDAVYVHDILDLTTEKYYRSVAEFADEFLNGSIEETRHDEASPALPQTDNRIFDPILTDIVLMNFMGGCCNNFVEVKKQIILDYIKNKIPVAARLSRTYLDACMETVKTAEADFYAALDLLLTKSPDEIEDIVREIVKVCQADGRLHYNEKVYLADILQTLRAKGFTPDIGI